MSSWATSPPAFSHIGLITAAYELDKARGRVSGVLDVPPEAGAYAPAAA